MFNTYQIKFSNRESFNQAHLIICDYNTRLDFCGSLDIGHADMIFSFFNEYHYKNAIKRLNEKNIVDFQ
jgi:hypothetical protein